MAAARRLSLAVACLTTALGAGCVKWAHYPTVDPIFAPVTGSSYRGTAYATRPSGVPWGMCGPLLPLLPNFPAMRPSKTRDPAPGVGADVFAMEVHLARMTAEPTVFEPSQAQLAVGGATYAPTRWRINDDVLDSTAPVSIMDTWILLIFDGVEKPDDAYSLRLPEAPPLTFRMETTSEWDVSLLHGCQ